jgi:hypothetical protein
VGRAVNLLFLAGMLAGVIAFVALMERLREDD